MTFSRSQLEGDLPESDPPDNNPPDTHPPDNGSPENDLPDVVASGDPASDALFNDSLRRISRLIPILAVAASAVLAARGHWAAGVGFLVGAVIAYVNFRWLKSTVNALAAAVTKDGERASRPSVVFRFLTRFVLIAFAAYVIFVSYPVSFQGFLAGLFVPVLAIFVEAGFVVFVSLRRGFPTG